MSDVVASPCLAVYPSSGYLPCLVLYIRYPGLSGVGWLGWFICYGGLVLGMLEFLVGLEVEFADGCVYSVVSVLPCVLPRSDRLGLGQIVGGELVWSCVLLEL